MSYGKNMNKEHFDVFHRKPLFQDAGVYHWDEPTPAVERFEQLYVALRRQEGWLMDDEAVRQLPYCEQPQTKDFWRWRRRSMLAWHRYVKKKNRDKQLFILDIGCGNGWLSYRTASLGNVVVHAQDVNRRELTQAARVFALPNLYWHFATGTGHIRPESFDLILLAASAQYFADLPALIEELLPLLRKGGEVHLLDTRFYKDRQACASACLRTAGYYREMGMEDMQTYYHHHCLEDLRPFRFKKRRNRRWRSHPLDWLCIYK